MKRYAIKYGQEYPGINVSSENGNNYQLWKFSEEKVFNSSLNFFIIKLNELQGMFQIAVSFRGLDKLEICGIHSKTLSNKLKLVIIIYTKCIV